MSPVIVCGYICSCSRGEGTGDDPYDIAFQLKSEDITIITVSCTKDPDQSAKISALASLGMHFVDEMNTAKLANQLTNALVSSEWCKCAPTKFFILQSTVIVPRNTFNWETTSSIRRLQSMESVSEDSRRQEEVGDISMPLTIVPATLRMRIWPMSSRRANTTSLDVGHFFPGSSWQNLFQGTCSVSSPTSSHWNTISGYGTSTANGSGNSRPEKIESHSPPLDTPPGRQDSRRPTRRVRSLRLSRWRTQVTRLCGRRRRRSIGCSCARFRRRALRIMWIGRCSDKSHNWVNCINN